MYDWALAFRELNGNNLLLVTYTRGNDLSGSLQEAGGIGGLLARTDNRQLTAGDVSANAYYHANGNGNITALVNTNQFLVARYHYDPYGNTLAVSGPLAEANLYRFSSKEWHPNSGLVYYLYRYYEPSLQWWLNCDPLGECGSLVVISSPAILDTSADDGGWGANTAILAALVEAHVARYRAFGNTPPNEMDFGGLDKHHYVPGPIRCDPELSEEARKVFRESTTPDVGKHDYSKPHPEYNKGVMEAWENWLKEKGKQKSQLSEEDAREFVERIKNSEDPRIKGFLDQLRKRAEEEAKKKAAIEMMRRMQQNNNMLDMGPYRIR